MRKAIFIGFTMLGAALGLFSAMTESIGVQIVMSSVGAVAGAAIGGGLASIRRRPQRGRIRDDEEQRHRDQPRRHGSVQARGTRLAIATWSLRRANAN